MPDHMRKLALTTCCFLWACGGGDSSGGGGAAAVIPTPTPPPTSSVVVSPLTGAALITPFFSVSPPPVYTDSSDTSFASPKPGSAMPLLQTFFGFPFTGDKETTEAGGQLSVGDDGRVRLTFGSASFGAQNLELATGTQRIGFKSLYPPAVIYISSLDETAYARSFSWGYGDINDDYGGGAAIGGFLTRPDRIPVSGSRILTGRAAGRMSQWQTKYSNSAIMDATVSLTHDYSLKQINGRIANFRVAFDGYGRRDPVNEMTFSATYDPVKDRFVGEVVAGPSPGGTNAFEEGSKGTIVLQSFGPNAEEVGGVLVIAGTNARSVIAILTK